MRDHIQESVGVVNPVFDVDAVNAHLRRLNVYLDGAMMDRNDAYEQRRPTEGPGEQQYEEYVGALLDGMLSDFAMDEEDAVDLMATVVGELETMGLLPSYPDAMEVALDEDFTAWLGAAQSIGLGAMMRKYAREGSILSTGS